MPEPGNRGGPSRLLGAGSALFAGALRLRRAVYDSGLRRHISVDRPVISVGNITVGGNGKTPFVVLLAQLLEKYDLRVAVVSRGYGAMTREHKKTPVLVSEAGHRFAHVMQAGDEPVLIAKRTRASVVACEDRVMGARYAIFALGAELIILDDGFQHWRIARDLDIVLVDAKDPFGNGRLLPAGTLREPKSALARADLIVVNHGLAGWKPNRKLPDLNCDAERVEVATVATTISPVVGVPVQAAVLAGKKVGLLAAIARPERFEDTVRALGVAEVVHRRFLRDHSWFEMADLLRFREACDRAGAELIVTTEKDAVRLSPEAINLLPNLRVLGLEMVITSGQERLESKILALLDRARR